MVILLVKDKFKWTISYFCQSSLL